jgi:hypothetical protein
LDRRRRRETVDQNRNDVVVIDTTPIGTVDFGMPSIEKELLLKLGKAAALRFLLARNLDDGPSRESVEAAEKDAEASRTVVLRKRAQKRWLWLVVLALVIAMVVYLLV